MKADPVLGTADDLEKSDEGWWTTVWLDRSHQYWAAGRRAPRRGQDLRLVGLAAELRQDRQDRRDPRLAVHRADPHPDPLQLLLGGRPGQGRDHFDEAKIGLSPALRGILSDLDSPPADLSSDLPSGGDEAAIQRLQGPCRPALRHSSTKL
jgi:hypothetical protein